VSSVITEHAVTHRSVTMLLLLLLLIITVSHVTPGARDSPQVAPHIGGGPQVGSEAAEPDHLEPGGSMGVHVGPCSLHLEVYVVVVVPTRSQNPKSEVLKQRFTYLSGRGTANDLLLLILSVISHSSSSEEEGEEEEELLFSLTAL